MNEKLKDKFPVSNNGSMAQNFEEMKKLGKEMENAKTNKELKEEEKLTPDPKQ
ncbi:hypothetical protein ACWM35_20300 [Neobacillus sp. K501]